MKSTTCILALALLGLTVTEAGAAQRKAPPTAYWLDAHTMSGMGAGGMTGIAAMAAGMGSGGQQRLLDLRLGSTLSSPASENAQHLIPSGLGMGPALPLTPVPGGTSTGVDGDHDEPKGRITLYWGCGAEVRPGQPQVIDLSNPQAAAKQMAAMRGGKATGPAPGMRTYRHWPNELDSKTVPASGSLAGAHSVTASSIPEIRFEVGAMHDFMEPVSLRQVSGTRQDAVTFNWTQPAGAAGYYAMAMGSRGEGATDMVVWSAGELPDMGWGLMNYLSAGEVAKYLKERAILPTTVTSCTIPRGIFKDVDGAMVQFIAYGDELNVDYPAAPKDPQWAVKLRRKSTAMMILDMTESGGASAGRSPVDEINPVGAILSIFGR